ncbi:MAG: hypothetical protein ACRCVX_00005, partial [Shewanella sp.]
AHWGHEGTRGMSGIDEAPAQHTMQADAGARTMRAFEHPLNKAVSAPADPYTNIPRPKGNPTTIGKTGTGIGTKSDVLAKRNNPDEPGKQKALSNLIPNHPVVVDENTGEDGAEIEVPVVVDENTGDDGAEIEVPVVVDENTGDDGAETVPLVVVDDDPGDDAAKEKSFPDLDPKEFASTRAKSVGEKYTKENLQYWLNQRGVNFSGNESQTQLAALLLQEIRK